MSERGEACEDCPLYVECKATNEEDAKRLELYDIAEQYREARRDQLIGRLPAQREQEIRQRFWNVLYGEVSNDEERREQEEMLAEINRDNIEFLAGVIDDYMSGAGSKRRMDEFQTQVRLHYREIFTDAVESRGCAGPTIERKLRLLGWKTIIKCNAPVDPVVKNLAENPKIFKGTFTKED